MLLVQNSGMYIHTSKFVIIKSVGNNTISAAMPRVIRDKLDNFLPIGSGRVKVLRLRQYFRCQS